MPTICAFHGITIRMYYDDHLPPHFHAYRAENSAKYCIRTGRRLAGRLPQRADAMVLKWQKMHQFELRRNWRLALQHRPLILIEPLDD
ncbi:MAG: DUF4160 domain-containing protein [Pseudohongiellaceae bacterium]